MSSDPRTKTNTSMMGYEAYAAIRGREQQLIDFNGGARSVGGNSANIINGVSDLNPLRPIYLGAAIKNFGPLPSRRPPGS